jgi:uncharacterized membrane protein
MNTIPRPLVRLNQTFVATSAILYLLTSHLVFLVLPIIIGLTSVLINYNPLFVIGKKFLKKPMFDYIQEDKAQQRFNQILALSMFSLAFISSIINQMLLSYIFAIMVFLASTIALMGFCIGCFIHYQYHMWKYRRSLIKA